MPSLSRHSDVAKLILRLAIGAIFLAHGLSKWSMEDPNTIFTILKFAEPLGGAAMIIGALTQLASLGLSIIMVGAIYMKMTGFGQTPLDPLGTFIGGWAYDMMILAGCIAILIMGPGSWSVDSKVLHKA